MLKLRKRDGKIVDFNTKKIERVIKLANNNVETEFKISDEKINDIVNQIEKNVLPKAFDDNQIIDIEEVQDLIEKFLIDNQCYGVIQEFSNYRHEREKERFKKLEITKRMEEKIIATKTANLNANVDESSFGGRIGEASSEWFKEMALDYYMPEKFAKLHNDNLIYIHDLNAYVAGMHNCLSIDIDKLLKNGFKTRQVDIRPSNSIGSAFELICVIFQIQSLQQFGGVAATHIDFSLAPYVQKSFAKNYISNYIKLNFDGVVSDLLDTIWKNDADEEYIDFEHKIALYENVNFYDKEIKDVIGKFYADTKLKFEDICFSNKEKLDKRLYNISYFDTISQVKQGAEGLFHNLNSLQSRSGNQLPFSSINFGLCTSEEGRLISKIILETCIKGLGPDYQTSIFPCLIFQYKKGITDKGSKNYDLFQLACYSSSKRIYPNYCNCDWTNQTNWDILDRNVKKNVIKKLSSEKESQLIEILNKNPEFKTLLNLDIVDNHIIVPDITTNPSCFSSTMGCRTVNGFDGNFTENYFENVIDLLIENGYIGNNMMVSGDQRDGRGNICPNTIILPMLAMKAKKKVYNKSNDNLTEKEKIDLTIVVFMKMLDEYIHLAKEELIERFRWISNQNVKSASFMYENNTMVGYNKEEGICSALKHGTVVIGQIGLAETLTILTGYNHLYSVCDIMKDKLEKKLERKLTDGEISEIEEFCSIKGN